jgi:hypothetical protein
LTAVRNIANIEVQVGATEVVFYREEDCSVPLLEWLDGLQRKPREKCLARLARLEELGHELRRPEADFLRDGIYELRAAYQGFNTGCCTSLGVRRSLSYLTAW